ncbi:MAG: tetratricopeptide repeat protein [Aquificaceae bacterium]
MDLWNQDKQTPDKTFVILVLLAFFISSCAHVLIVKDPLSAEESFQLGYIYHTNSDYRSASYHYQRAIKKDPKNWKALYNLGTLYASAGRFEDAIKTLERVLELKDNQDIRNNLSYSYYMLQKPCDALWHFQMGKVKNHELFELLKPHKEFCLHWEFREWTDTGSAF